MLLLVHRAPSEDQLLGASADEPAHPARSRRAPSVLALGVHRYSGSTCSHGRRLDYGAPLLYCYDVNLLFLLLILLIFIIIIVIILLFVLFTLCIVFILVFWKEKMECE